MVPGERSANLTPEGAAMLEAERPSRSRGGTARLLLEGMRPRQWVKNAFVLGGTIYSGQALELDVLGLALATLGAFCLASGAAYLVNDVRDADGDRLNPRTAGRPVARGALAPRTALAGAGAAALASLAITALVNWETLATLAGFLLLQAAYSLWLKHVLFVDVMAVAAGFVLRAFAGLVAIDVLISEWLLLCTGLLALFLGFGKRRGEAVALGGESHPQRPVLEQYSVELIDELIAVVTPAIIVAYSLYAVLGAETQAMMLTVPFVMYGIFRVLFLIHHRSTRTEDPTTVVWQDRPLQLCVALWGISAGTIAILA
jgi:4-hydroxybenzoate polyprenyltransferase